MIVVDVNLLLYAYDSASLHHRAARHWLEGVFLGVEPVGLAWVTLVAFLRIGTNPRARRDAFTIAEASTIVSEWLARPTVTLVSPGERHWEILRALLAEGQAAGPLVTDAHLAALAIEHGAELATVDRDFARFPGLRFFNPLIPAPESR